MPSLVFARLALCRVPGHICVAARIFKAISVVDPLLCYRFIDENLCLLNFIVRVVLVTSNYVSMYTDPCIVVIDAFVSGYIKCIAHTDPQVEGKEE
jgi:hypothetical protein